ncbi:MAG: flavin reductase family protein, partial [Candidatus Micrarchaeota archaeon]
ANSKSDFMLNYQTLYPSRVVLVTSVDSAGKPNIITLAWTAILSMNPFMVGVSIAPGRHSHKLISETKEFVVNLPSFELEQACIVCGTTSGRNADKFKEAGLTPLKSEKVKAPRIAECYAWLECRLVNSLETGDHTLFIGEVVASGEQEARAGPVYDILGERLKEIKL